MGVMKRRNKRTYYRHGEHNHLNAEGGKLRDKLLKQSQDNARRKQTAGGFAEPVGADNDVSLLEQERTADYHGKLLGGGRNGDPNRQPARRRKAHKRGNKHKLVSQRVEQLSDVGYPVVAARQIPVQYVGQEGDDVCDKCAHVFAARKQSDKHTDEQQSYAGDYVWYIAHISRVAERVVSL